MRKDLESDVLLDEELEMVTRMIAVERITAATILYARNCGWEPHIFWQAFGDGVQKEINHYVSEVYQGEVNE